MRELAHEARMLRAIDHPNVVRQSINHIYGYSSLFSNGLLEAMNGRVHYPR